MADDRTRSGGHDATRINILQDDELRDWAAKFGVTPEELQAAVAAGGTSAKGVERELKGR